MGYAKKLKDPSTLRIFFSSPFNGMEGEREELTRQYFPWLRHMCNSVGVEFVAVDMRWGITSESSAQNQVINICLGELEKSDIFIGFFGQRYGWHGKEDSALQENFNNAVGRYPWVEEQRDKSVTELEFLGGHLNHPGNLPAFICFRDKAYDDELRAEAEKKGDKRGCYKYSSESELATKMMNDLKGRIMETKDKLLGLNMAYENPKEGARLMFEAIKSHLENHLLGGTNQKGLNLLDVQMSAHEAYLASHTKLYEGGKRFIDQLNKNMDQEEPKNLLITGVTGIGKSALISNWLVKVRGIPNGPVFVNHFVGYAENSTAVPNLLKRFVGEFTRHVNKLKGIDELKKQEDTDAGEDVLELQRKLLVVMEELVTMGKQAVIVIDGVDKVAKKMDLEKPLYWLPQEFPKRCFVVITTTSSDEVSIKELRDNRKFEEIKIPELDQGTKQTVCIKALAVPGKQLSPGQLSKIVEAEQTSNPLFLKIVLAELIMFGYFRLLDKKIESLVSSKDVEELFIEVLERLEDDFQKSGLNTNIVEQVMCGLCLTNHGLSETEIQDIFHIPVQVWVTLSYSIEAYIIRRMGLLRLGFNEMRRAIEKKYLQERNKRLKYLDLLLSYFDQKRKNQSPLTNLTTLVHEHSRYSQELPSLCLAANKIDHLVAVLADLSVSNYICSMQSKYDLLTLWRKTGLSWPQVAEEYMKSVSQKIVDCYLSNQEGNSSISPGLQVLSVVKFLYNVFTSTNDFIGSKRILERYIEIAEENMEDVRRSKQLYRDYLFMKYSNACNYVNHNQMEEGYSLHQEVIQERKKLVNEEGLHSDKVDLGTSYHGMGVLCVSTYRYEEALEYLYKSMEYLPNDEDSAKGLLWVTNHNIGLCKLYLGHLDEALEYFNLSLKAVEELSFGHLSPMTGIIISDMGLAYRRKGDLDKAEQCYLQALGIKKKAYGNVHSEIPITLLNLGTLYSLQEKYGKAFEFFQESCDIYKKCEVPKNHEGYVRAQENRLMALVHLGDTEQIMKDFKPLLNILIQEKRMDLCLEPMWTGIARYCLTNEKYDDALKITLGLMGSTKKTDVNYVHLDFLDNIMHPNGDRPERPKEMTLDYGFTLFPGSVELLRQQCMTRTIPSKDVDEFVRLCNRFHDNYPSERTPSLYDYCIRMLQDFEPLDVEMLFAVSQAAHEKYPQSDAFMQNIVSVLQSQKRYEEAKPYLKKLLNLLPQDESILFRAIQGNVLSGAIDEGMELINLGLERFKDQEKTIEKLEGMKALLTSQED